MMLRTADASMVSLAHLRTSTIRAKDVSNPRALSRAALAEMWLLRADRCDGDHGEGTDFRAGVDRAFADFGALVRGPLFEAE